MTMTDGEKMVWAAAFVQALNKSTPESAAASARIATITVKHHLRLLVAGLGEDIHKHPMLQEMTQESIATKYDCHECKCSVILDPMIEPNAYSGLCPTCYEESR